MANERLRSALLSNGYTATTLAAELDVDRKSVERWVSGRRPYRRHRYAAAELLGLEESYLWPDALEESQVAAASGSEIVTVYPHRSTVPRDTWRRLLDAGEREVTILETAGVLLADDPSWRSLLAARVASGARVRVLLDAAATGGSAHAGQEADESAAAPAVEGSAAEGYAAEAPATERSPRARELVEQLGELNGVDVRVHAVPPFASVYRADDGLLVTCHIPGVPAAQAPVLQLARVAGGQLVAAYIQSLEHIWREARPLDRSS